MRGPSICTASPPAPRAQTSLARAEKETLARKADVEVELSSITPMVEAAKEAVGSIKRENLDEIRSLKAPPEAIADVLSAVLMLLGINDTSWSAMKKFLGNRGVKDDILAFDVRWTMGGQFGLVCAPSSPPLCTAPSAVQARALSAGLRGQVSAVMKAKADSFEQATIYRASVAAAPLAAWVKAQIKYSSVLERISPLENELGEATQALVSSQQALARNKAELGEIDLKVGRLKTVRRGRRGGDTGDAKATEHVILSPSPRRSSGRARPKLRRSSRRWHGPRTRSSAPTRSWGSSRASATGGRRASRS